jgi:hypothetical protein
LILHDKYSKTVGAVATNHQKTHITFWHRQTPDRYLTPVSSLPILHLDKIIVQIFIVLQLLEEVDTWGLACYH